jgi:hypothetical protein
MSHQIVICGAGSAGAIGPTGADGAITIAERCADALRAALSTGVAAAAAVG